jgi:uncharacterized membrane protein
MPSWLLPGFQQLQNLHPLVVHFPIALLYTAVLLYAGALVLGSEPLKWSALWVLVLGALSAGVAVATGYYASEGVMIAPSVREALLEHHEDLMVTTAIIAGVLAVWALAARPMPARWRWLFIIALVVMLGVMTVGADFGGRMVYDYNAGGNACGQPIPFTK